jgi:two-component system, NarL family, sensor histidine kinase UhpB
MRARLRRGAASLAVRTFLAGAAVLLLVFVLLVVTPVEVSYPIQRGEVAILVGGLLAMLAIQLLLARRALAPLRRLAAQMENIDLREPSQRLVVAPDQGPMISAFIGAFNAMLERLAAERRQSAHAALGAQEAERLRTAHELHDEIGQSLTAVALQVEQLAATADAPTAARLDEVAELLQGSLDDIRRIVRELRPEALDDLGLVNALIALTSRISRQTNIRLERRLGGELPPLSPEQELVIYRVAQESLTNVVRHSGATVARVALERDEGVLVLNVSDDGRGILGRGTLAGSGIEGMRERALLVGATLRIEPEPNGGTNVRLVVPVGSAEQ